MMFSKYVSKITNTIGTINYLQQKSGKGSVKPHSKWRNSSKQNFYDEGLDVEDGDQETNNNHINIDLSNNPSQILTDCSTTESQIILTASIAKLRNTLFVYELV